MESEIMAKGYYLPDDSALDPTIKSTEKQNQAGSVNISYLDIDPDGLDRIVGSLRDSQALLREKTDRELLHLMDSNLELWADPNYEGRKMSREILPITLGYSPEMVDAMLASTFKTLKEDLGDVATGKRDGLVVTRFTDIPGAQIVTVIESLCQRSPCLCKAPYTEPVFTGLYLDSIRESDPSLGKCVASVSWKEDDPLNHGLEKALYKGLGDSDMIVHYGSEKAADDIRSLKNPGTAMKAFTRGLGMIVLGNDKLSTRSIEETVRDCSMAVSFYNRGSCVSPQLIFAEEGGEVSPGEFSRMLAEEMDRVAKEELPLGYVPKDNYARFAQAHQSNILRQILGSISYFPVSDGSIPIGGVIYLGGDHKDLPKSELRMVSVIPCSNLSGVPEELARFDGQLHSVGLGMGRDRYGKLEDEIQSSTGARVTPLDKMLRLSFRDYPIYKG